MRLAADQVYRLIKPVEIGPVLAVLGGLGFIHVNQGQKAKYECDVLLRAHFPPELVSLIEGLGLGGETARAILRKLHPRQSIPVHVDEWMPGEADWRRFQIPITSHPNIVMRWPMDGAEVHLAPGFLYEVRFDRPHEVIHGADCERIHLQVDQIDATI